MGFVCWLQYGVLAMKDRLATVVIWTGAFVAFIPLVAVIGYVIIKGSSGRRSQIFRTSSSPTCRV